MRKFILITALLLLVMPVAIAAARNGPKGVHEPGTGIENSELKQENQGTGQGRDQGQQNDKALTRRSRVANAVQEMFQVAERQGGGIGEQIRNIAQNQNQNQEQIEANMEKVKNRGRLKKFFFGPDYRNLSSIEERLANHTEKLNELKELASQLVDQADIVTLENQIEVMEQVKTEIENEVAGEKKGFSLFGWLNRLLVK